MHNALVETVVSSSDAIRPSACGQVVHGSQELRQLPAAPSAIGV